MMTESRAARLVYALSGISPEKQRKQDADFVRSHMIRVFQEIRDESPELKLVNPRKGRRTNIDLLREWTNGDGIIRGISPRFIEGEDGRIHHVVVLSHGRIEEKGVVVAQVDEPIVAFSGELLFKPEAMQAIKESTQAAFIAASSYGIRDLQRVVPQK